MLDDEQLTNRLAPLVYGALRQRKLKCLDDYRNQLSSIIKQTMNEVKGKQGGGNSGDGCSPPRPFSATPQPQP